jgi:iron complex transport system ATP-binding protein
LRLQQGKRVLADNLNLALAPGMLMALVGPNGVGKSTLLRTLAQSAHLTKGQWQLHGRPVRQWALPDMARTLVYVPQHAQLHFALQVHEVVGLGLYPHRKALDAAPGALVRQALAATDMAWAYHRPYDQLSGGEQQRVQLSRSWAQATAAGGPAQRVLLMDEPTASLDPRHALAWMAQVRTLCAKGMACLWVVHDLNLALQYASHALLLGGAQGRCCGPVETVLQPRALEAVFGCGFTALPTPDAAMPWLLLAQ